jgi:hypothetical protein
MADAPTAIRPGRTSLRRWPMTPEAWWALRAELDRLQDDLGRLAGGPSVDDGGLIHLPARDAPGRLEALREVLSAADPTDVAGRAIIGRRVTIREDDGDVLTYALVIPGEGDPMNGWISVDSPLGAALLEAMAGDDVHFVAPCGPRGVRVVAVE